MEIKETAVDINNTAKEKGFWDKERNVGELLMLVTSELGEALEAHRKGKFASKGAFESYMVDWKEDFMDYDRKFKSEFENCIKDSFEDEIGDAIIRLLDLAEGLNIDIEWFIKQKMEYNKTRERLHGKAY